MNYNLKTIGETVGKPGGWCRQFSTGKKVVNGFPDSFKVGENNISDEFPIAEGFNHFFANIGSELSANIPCPPNKSFNDFLTGTTPCTFSFDPCTPSEILKIISKLPSKNSAGHDDLSNKVIKYIGSVIAEPLSIIINQSFDTGIFPNVLKLAKVLPIFKKDDNQIFTNYRPISLLPVISKIFEKVSYIQFYNFLVQNKLLYGGQHGFRTQHSTETALYEFVDKVNNFLDTGYLPLATYLDLSKAFDTLDHSILLAKLNYYGVKNAALSWFQSYLTGRTQYTVFKECSSSTYPLITGVPQGSILGPLLFLVYFNDIYRSSNKVNMIMYADDTTVLFPLSPSNLQRDISVVNQELQNIQAWLSLNKLSLNISKTKYMVFHFPQRKIDFENFPSPYINNEPIIRTSEFDFLGVIVHENLSWKPHVAKISIKIARTTGVLKRLQHTIPKHILKLLYNSLILPHLCYGILAWGVSCPRIQILQKKAIRYINKSKYNAHTEPLFKNNCLLNIADLYTLKSLKLYYKYEKESLPDYFTHMFLSHQTENPYNTRQGSTPIPQQPLKSACSNVIRYKIPLLIANTPLCILNKINTHSLDGFSWYIKRIMVNEYKVTCVIENCYICGT